MDSIPHIQWPRKRFSSSFAKEVAVLQKIVRAVPVPTLIGFIFSLVAIFVGWVLSVNVTVVFLFIVLLAWILLFLSEYKLPFWNHALLVSCVLLGHLPYLGVKFIFF